MLHRGDRLVLAILTRRAALECGRPVRVEQLVDDAAPVSREEVLAALERLTAAGAIFRVKQGWRVRAVPIGPDITPISMAARLHREADA